MSDGPAATLRGIRLVVTDIDGVWTDGGMYYDGDGYAFKKFNTADSQGVLFCRAVELPVAIITGEADPAVAHRAEKLGIERVHLGVGDKRSLAAEICREVGTALERTAFIGDGLNDLELLRAVGFAGTVPDAPAYVKRDAHYVTRRRGGEGAFLDFVEELLRRTGRLEEAIERCLRGVAPADARAAVRAAVRAEPRSTS